jgi:tetratricopeptide (TPR) repeat protein
MKLKNFFSNLIENSFVKKDVDEGLIGEAIQFQLNKQYHKAIEICDYLINKGDKSLQTLLIKGICQLRIYDFPNCEKTFTLAIELYPTAATLYFHRATLYTMSNALELGIKDILIAIEIDQKPDFYLQLAVLYSKNSEYKKCIEIIDKIIQENSLKKFIDKCYYIRGYSHFHLENYDLALNDFDSSISHNTSTGIVYYYRSQNYLKLNKEFLANIDIDFAIMKGNSNETWYQEAINYRNTNFR